MSSVASVAFTFWAVLTEPSSVNLRKGLWIISAFCFVIGSYRVWATEHREVQRLYAEAEEVANQIIREFEEIKTNILLSTLVPVIGTELKRLKECIHKYPGMLHRPDVRKFYKMFIVPKEIHLEHGASLDFTKAEYKRMKKQLGKISLRSNAD